MNNRGLIVATLGFFAALGAERLYASLVPDIERYNRMRAMSGQAPILKELLTSAGGLFGGGAKQSGARAFVAAMTNDVVRYAKMRGM